MVYGLNFNGTQIPAGIKRKFPEIVKPFGMVKFYLKGVASSESERDLMLIVATDGKRNLHVESRIVVGFTWYGVYAS